MAYSRTKTQIRCCLALLTAVPLWGQLESLMDGERLVYRAGFRLLAAGETVMETSARVSTEGDTLLHVTARTRTDPFFDALYPIDDHIELWLEPGTGALRRMVRDLNEGRFHRRDSSWVDTAQMVLYTRGDTLQLAGPVFDPIGAIYHLRSLDVVVGDTVRLTIFDGRRLRPIAVRVSGPVMKASPAGTFECLALLPVSLDERQLTKAGDVLRLWLSNDERRLPVRIEQRASFGLLVLRLLSVSP